MFISVFKLPVDVSNAVICNCKLFVDVVKSLAIAVVDTANALSPDIRFAVSVVRLSAIVVVDVFKLFI